MIQTPERGRGTRSNIFLIIIIMKSSSYPLQRVIQGLHNNDGPGVQGSGFGVGQESEWTRELKGLIQEVESHGYILYNVIPAGDKVSLRLWSHGGERHTAGHVGVDVKDCLKRLLEDIRIEALAPRLPSSLPRPATPVEDQLPAHSA